MRLQDLVDANSEKLQNYLPKFGPYAKERKALLAAKKKDEDLLGENKVKVVNRPGFKPSTKVPSVQEVIGRALDSIGTYSDLDNK